jgi:transposase
VAKGESQVQVFLDKKQPYKKSFKVAHTLEGLNSLLDFIKEVEDVSGGNLPIPAGNKPLFINICRCSF